MKRIDLILIATMILFFVDPRVCRSDVREAHAATFVVVQDVVIAASPEVVPDAAVCARRFSAQTVIRVAEQISRLGRA